MATDGLRRSGRVRKPVKSFANEQAEDLSNVATHGKTTTRKRKFTEPDDSESNVKVKRSATVLDNSPEPTEHSAPATKSGKERSSEAVKKNEGLPKDETKAKPSNPSESKPLPTMDPNAEPVTLPLNPKTESQPAARPPKASKPSRIPSNQSWFDEGAQRRIAFTKSKVKRLAPGQPEYRLRNYVDEPPKSYHDFLKRAKKERMFVLERQRGVEEACHANHTDCPCEQVKIAGSTGNVYTVTISHLPSCTCPVGIFTLKGQEKLCKHTLYVLHHVLKAPESLKQQNAYLTSELHEIFSKAPAMPSDVVEDEGKDGNRKAIEDDCPICCMEFEEGDEVVWCQSSCGNNLHKACFDQWARTKARVTCPFCRADWEDAASNSKRAMTVTKVNMPIAAGMGGYRNVRDQLDYDA